VKKVTVIDYGMGNLFSVARAIEYCGAEVVLAQSPTDIREAERLILPGVGAFESGMSELRSRYLVDSIQEYCARGRPMLGICLGMQMLFDVGEEFGLHQGLKLLPGKVVMIPTIDEEGRSRRIPHIGWSHLMPQVGCKDWDQTLLDGIEPMKSVYFVHSFMAVPNDLQNRIANCNYDGVSIASVVQRENVHGCQFHPEKSGDVGLKILQNFLKI